MNETSNSNDLSGSEKAVLKEIILTFYHEVDQGSIEEVCRLFREKGGFSPLAAELNQDFFKIGFSDTAVDVAASLLQKGLGTIKFQLVRQIIRAFGSPYGSFLISLGKLRTSFVDSTLKERLDFLSGWAMSPLKDFRSAAKLFFKIATMAYVSEVSTLQNVNGRRESRFLSLLDYSKPPKFVEPVNPWSNIEDEHIRLESVFQSLSKLDLSRFLEPEPIHLNYDAVVIGSGCGGGVAASFLAKAGHKVLVCEKSGFYRQENITLEEKDSLEKMYLNGGFLPTEDGSVAILAGSCIGGGSTVNWSASLKPPQYLRKEWADDLGLKVFATNDFDKAIDFVSERIGVSAPHQQNEPNSILLNGCKKLGLEAREVPQNTKGKVHLCGQCGLGCANRVKQGTMETFLVDAGKEGAKFAWNFNVLKILRSSDGRATGVYGIYRNTFPVYISCKLVVCSAGSMNTPIVLRRSGFKNKHIGKNLKLHPVAGAFGLFPEKSVYPWKGSILTSICPMPDASGDVSYGAKIEIAVAQPIISASALTFPSAIQGISDPTVLARALVYNLKHSVLIMSLQRDKDSVGSVYEDKYGKLCVEYKLSDRDEKSIRTGLKSAIDILVTEGAKVVATSVDDIAPCFMEKDPVSDLKQALDSHKLNAGFNCSLFSAHQMSSCRMASNETDGACDPSGKLWEADNVFVCDGSVLPTATGVNPMLTILSTSVLIAKECCKKLNQLKQ
ncbi:hypothetical protein MP638_001145 [Amoeboaphelidium occidentale]|nr:hypothetical protein MP638_001145 [Amoeboaphelidium occidentale]